MLLQSNLEQPPFPGRFRKHVSSAMLALLRQGASARRTHGGVKYPSELWGVKGARSFCVARILPHRLTWACALEFDSAELGPTDALSLPQVSQAHFSRLSLSMPARRQPFRSLKPLCHLSLCDLHCVNPVKGFLLPVFELAVPVRGGRKQST